MFLNCNIAFSSMPVFLPSVLHEYVLLVPAPARDSSISNTSLLTTTLFHRMGYTAVTSQALSAPPYLFAFAVMLLTARASDRAGKRAPFVCFHAALGAAGYALVALGGARQWPNVVRYLAVYPSCAGFFSAITIIIAWTMNNQAS